MTAETLDPSTLQDLGRASVQIVHDLKNQLNGLKLYATFLRKRMETSERPQDELEAMAKLIAGLDRTAENLTALVRYGRPIELRTQPGVLLGKILSGLQSKVAEGRQIQLDLEDDSIVGDFDFVALSDALKSITKGALKMCHNDDPLLIRQRRDNQCRATRVLVEWRNIETGDRDVFRSFAGSDGLRMALAAKVIEAHHGSVEQQDGALCVNLPIQERVN